MAGVGGEGKKDQGLHSEGWEKQVPAYAVRIFLFTLRKMGTPQKDLSTEAA